MKYLIIYIYIYERCEARVRNALDFKSLSRSTKDWTEILRSECSEYYEKHIGVFGNLDDHLRSLQGRKKLDSLNSFLSGKFKYEVRENQNDDNRIEFISFFDRSDVVMNSSDLSDGEQLKLTCLLWAFQEAQLGASEIPTLLLMDEPDAHFHPRLAKLWIDTVYHQLVERCNIQVIMCTHRPTTVSMIPKDFLFTMISDPTYGARIRPAKSKREIFKLLTSDVIALNEPFRLIFCEAPNDKKVYESIYQKLLGEQLDDFIIPPSAPTLIFKSRGKKKR